MNRSALCAILGALTLAACAGPQPGSPAWTASQEQKKQEVRAETVKASVDDLPSWYASPPNDEFSIYAPGTATSTDLQFAEDKAVLGAKRSLADRINSKLSSKMKEFLSESGAGENTQVMAESERVTSNLITEVNLSGYAITEKKFVPAGQQYRAYVLLQYPLGSANRILVDQVNKNSLLQGKVRASKAFQDLERDIQDARKGAGVDSARKE
ncbi:hypothetical protein H261_00585 [Paramagnetospirillum caucaseum]|uniref:Lipoprotein LPP20-like domain-containing protein n=1 Tax=Paramagnetospirillum caucaseum TaxID=1244869 RepID=M2ZC70_9PROT|nr:hypothetical protein [Paramagnetospirillum caucaseum]EME72030.1 hypothetical protein H261_00585 [Paramagnetospirillum caucaseum]